jgi:hypothetical protein
MSSTKLTCWERLKHTNHEPNHYPHQLYHPVHTKHIRSQGQNHRSSSFPFPPHLQSYHRTNISCHPLFILNLSVNRVVSVAPSVLNSQYFIWISPSILVRSTRIAVIQSFNKYNAFKIYTSPLLCFTKVSHWDQFWASSIQCPTITWCSFKLHFYIIHPQAHTFLLRLLRQNSVCICHMFLPSHFSSFNNPKWWRAHHSCSLFCNVNHPIEEPGQHSWYRNHLVAGWLRSQSLICSGIKNSHFSTLSRLMVSTWLPIYEKIQKVLNWMIESSKEEEIIWERIW